MGTQAGGEAGAQRRAGRGKAQEDSFLLGQEREFKPLLSAPRLPQRWKKKTKHLLFPSCLPFPPAFRARQRSAGTGAEAELRPRSAQGRRRAAGLLATAAAWLCLA